MCNQFHPFNLICLSSVLFDGLLLRCARAH
jgi:hypothetical protein